MPKFYIGTSGWSYNDWRGRFYPEDLPAKQWLKHYIGHFKTVEINNTFYHLPLLNTVINWYKIAPPDFIFAVKGSRYITHIKRLKDCRAPLKKFFALIKHFRGKLGPILWQLPPAMGKDETRLRRFIKLLPKRYQHAFEFRNQEWYTEEIYKILKDNDCALVIFDMPGRHTPEVLTADWAYLRFHGATSLYGTKYSNIYLKKWRDKMAKWRKLKYIYIYFNNDTKAAAIENASYLKKLY